MFDNNRVAWIADVRGALIAIPKTPGSYSEGWQSPKTRPGWEAQERLGAGVFGIVHPDSQTEKEVSVSWPTFQRDQVVWVEWISKKENLRFLPTQSVREMLDQLPNQLNSDAMFPGGHALALAEDVLGNSIPPGVHILLFGMVDGDRGEAYKEVKRFKDKQSRPRFLFGKGIAAPDPLVIWWEAVYASISVLDDSWRRPRREISLSTGFHINDVENSNPERVEVLTDDQTTRLVEEYRRTLLGFIDKIDEAYKFAR
jgi:hypothetical protein